MKAKHILAIIFSSLYLVSSFLPWAISKFSVDYFWVFENTDNNPLLAFAILGIVLGIGGILFAIFKPIRIYSIIFGILSFVNAILGFVVLNNEFGEVADPAWGLFLFAAFSLAYLIVTIIILVYSD